MSGPSSSDLSAWLAIARDLVEKACELLGDARDIGTVESKSTSRDLVTEWDTRIEDMLCSGLAKATPDIPILGEERGAKAAEGQVREELRWLVDPIDGTVNFAHGLPLFGVTISLEHAGTPVVGVTAAPVLGWLGYATLGQGAWNRDGRRLRVSRITELERSMLVSGFPYDRAETRHNFAEWEHMQCRAGACRRLGAVSLDLFMVASGWLDGHWESRLSPWDISAGALLVREAGGTVTSITGGALDTDSGNLLATNGAIHDQVLAELEVVWRARTS